jgi:hypothetical protein
MAHDRRGERRQRRVVPPPLSDAGKGGFTEAHLELVAQDDTEDEVLPIPPGTLATRDGRGDDVRRVRGVLLPVDVVVVHHADHQRVRERCRDRIDARSAAQNRRRPFSRDLIEQVERDLDILLLVSAKSAAQRIEQVPFRLVDRLLAQVFVL